MRIEQIDRIEKFITSLEYHALEEDQEMMVFQSEFSLLGGDNNRCTNEGVKACGSANKKCTNYGDICQKGINTRCKDRPLEKAPSR